MAVSSAAALDAKANARPMMPQGKEIQDRQEEKSLGVCTWQSADVTSAEIAGLMHVNPQAVQGELAMQALDLCCPPIDSLLRKEVWKVCSAWPQLRSNGSRKS